MSNRGRWYPFRFRGGYRNNRGRGGSTGCGNGRPGANSSIASTSFTGASQHGSGEESFAVPAAPCPYPSWRKYLTSEAYNPVSESARLVQILIGYFEKSLGFIDLEELDQSRSYELDFQEILSDMYIQENLPKLFEIMRDNSTLLLGAAGVAFTSVLENRQKEDSTNSIVMDVPHVDIRLKNIGAHVPFGSIKASYYGKFIAVKGTVARISAVKPFCLRLAFQCVHCDAVFPVSLPDGRYTTPSVCRVPGCQSQTINPIRNHRLTETIDWQQLRLQENLTNMEGETGRVPRTIDCELTGDLVGSCVPGDQIIVCGVVKVATNDQGKGKNKDKCTFTLNIRANSITKPTKRTSSKVDNPHSGLGGDKSSGKGANNSMRQAARLSIELSTRDLYCIQTIYDQEDVFKLLVHSLCPSIYGHELVKASLLLGLFGGCQKFAGSGSHVPIRGDPHILIVGDPGLGKSQMLQAASAVAPRGVYVCGNTATSSGLTVTLSKESGTGDYSLEAGALVLADQGVCCIDEFDKMTQQHQALLEAMEQQSVSIAKAGIVCNLPSRTAVLAAANPVGGHYNKAKTVAENLRISGPLLSRFDLVFILLDKPDQEMDSLLSAHVMALHGSKQQTPNITTLSQAGASLVSQSVTIDGGERPLRERLRLSAGETLDLLPPPLLKKYISYARDYVYPKITEAAAKVIQDFFIELRRKHHSSDSTPITTRQLESLVRLTEARAKLELREEATEQDALDIIEIMKYSMVDTYSDETGVLDFTRNQNGSGMSNRAAAQALVKLMHQQFKKTLNDMFTVADIKQLAQSIRMYGLLLEGIYYYIRTIFGEETLRQIRAKANVNHNNFSTHQVYSETVIPRLAKAAQDVTGMPVEELMESFGVTFVSYVSRYGYDRILKVLGRNVRDFLSNLDNLHEYLRFSYPKIKPPSFFVTDESEDGLTLHYRSKRRGFKNYIKGQVRQVGKEFYNTDIRVEELSCDEARGLSQVVFRLSFDNRDRFVQLEKNADSVALDLPITPKAFFSLFPFHMVLDNEMVILSVGGAMNSILPHLVGAQIDDLFHLDRPMIEFTWDNVLMHTNNVFEMQSIDAIENRCDDDFSEGLGGEGSIISGGQENSFDDATSIGTSDHHRVKKTLVLRGQMLHMLDWNAILFLGTPVMENLEHMFRLGLYINDLSIHDSSRELVLAGTQQSAELKLLLDQEQTKSKKLEESMKKLDMEMKKTDQLLYQMIPKTVADRLRSGEPAVSTCEVFDICTILFSDVVGFTNICSAISPMQVVTMLNGMYTSFDTLIEKHHLYKVETIGDAYMIVGGVPKKSDTHAVQVAQMAFSMLSAMVTLKDPSDRTGKGHLMLRVGVHSGTVVAGVVGLKMPRYCLFGDTVNTASRMESNGEAMKIHCSEATKDCLEDYPQYKFEERGTIEIKGKGAMSTYWLLNDTTYKPPAGGSRPALTRANAKDRSTPEVKFEPNSPEQQPQHSSLRNGNSQKAKYNVSIVTPDRTVPTPDPPTNLDTIKPPVPAYQQPPPEPPIVHHQDQILPSSQPFVEHVHHQPVNHSVQHQQHMNGHHQQLNSTKIAAVEPSPVKPAISDADMNGSKSTLPGYGAQKNMKQPVVPTSQGCNSITCTIL